MGGVHLGVKQVLGIWLVAAGAWPRLSRLSPRPATLPLPWGARDGRFASRQPGPGKT